MNTAVATRQLDLVEYERMLVRELTADQALALQASGAVSVTLTRHGYELTAGGLVGAVAVNGVQLRINPKVTIRRLLYLVGYANDPGWREEDLPALPDDDLVVAVAAMLCRHAERALASGVLQGYRHREEPALTVRGRIRTSDQMGRRFGMPIPVEVAYDDYDTDIAENQILRTALRVIRQLPGLDTATRQHARRLHGLLGGATELPPGVVPEVPLTRLNRRYGPALTLARLVLTQRSPEAHTGSAPAQAFLVDMPKVFEAFLTAALREALEPYGGDALAQHSTQLDTAGAVEVRPDLVWRRNGHVRAVIDAKYKSLAGLTGPSGDVYQALAYCVAHDLPRCWLLYATENHAARTHTVRHLNATIHVATIDLGCELADLHAAIRHLADDMTAAARRPLHQPRAPMTPSRASAQSRQRGRRHPPGKVR